MLKSTEQLLKNSTMRTRRDNSSVYPQIKHPETNMSWPGLENMKGSLGEYSIKELASPCLQWFSLRFSPCFPLGLDCLCHVTTCRGFMVSHLVSTGPPLSHDCLCLVSTCRGFLVRQLVSTGPP
jgi:hypothetical protein